eukprot:COSAG01_NODE_31779_length_591_cov_2.634146_2_plen_105_part_01
MSSHNTSIYFICNGRLVTPIYRCHKPPPQEAARAALVPRLCDFCGTVHQDDARYPLCHSDISHLDHTEVNCRQCGGCTDSAVAIASQVAVLARATVATTAHRERS